jgi:hypothetical protein
MKQCYDQKKELRAISQVLGQMKKDALAHARTCLHADDGTPQQVFYTQDNFLLIFFFGYFKDLIFNQEDNDSLKQDSSIILNCIHSSAVLYFLEQEEPEEERVTHDEEQKSNQS